jgi:hypothetical protein
MPRTIGAKTFYPSDQNRRTVEAMAACGVPQPMIAAALGISPSTLNKKLRVELDTGLHKANARIVQFLFTGIVGSETQEPFQSEHDRIVAAMFWLKCRAGWKETQVVEVLRPISEMSDEEIDRRLGIEDAKAENVVSFPRR